MAHVFALLLALVQAPAAPPPASFDARWVTAFETPAATTPGFDTDSAYVPLKGGQLVAIDLNRGTIRWTLDVATEFPPATGDGMVFTVTEQTIAARDGKTLTQAQPKTCAADADVIAKPQFDDLGPQVKLADHLSQHLADALRAFRPGPVCRGITANSRRDRGRSGAGGDRGGAARRLV